MAKITTELPGNAGGIAYHNDLLGLNVGDYLHLTASEKSYFDSIPSVIDSKVEDQIVDGVIDKAPSQNAVFDADVNVLNSANAYTDSIQYIRITATNKTGSTISKGSVVYVSGAQGSNATIALSLADSNDITSKVVGIVYQDLANNTSGYVYTNGIIDSLNTLAFNEGDQLYLSPTTPGGLTTTIPSSPNQVIFIGTCLRQHNTQGKILIEVQLTFRLDRLRDVNVTSATTNQILYKASDGFWKAESVGSALSPYISGTTNFVSKFTSSNTLGNSLIQDNGGNVGIGGIGTFSRFQVWGTTQSNSTIAQVYQGLAVATTYITSTGDYGFGLDSAVGGTERMRITSGGNLLLGTSINNGIDRLQVYQYTSNPTSLSLINQFLSDVSSTNGTSGELAFRASPSSNALASVKTILDGNTSSGRLAFFTNTNAFGSPAVERMTIKATGNVLINTTTDNGVDKLQVNGSIFSTAFKKSGGTSSQFLKADGSVDSTVYENTINKGVANGYASLDSGGKVPVSQLPNSIMEYKGNYNAATNTPTLIDGTGDTGDTYRVNVAGAGVNGLNFVVGDYVIYNGTAWEKAHSGGDAVNSVFGRAGVITAQAGDYIASQITNTPSGNISSITVQAALNELDSEKVSKSGDTMTGSLTSTAFIKTGATSDDVLLGDGTTASKSSFTEQRVAVSNTNYTITGTNNQLIAYTAITASRSVFLPAATTANQRIWITDESGLASAVRSILVVPNGTDTIGGDSFAAVTFPNGSGYFESNGSGKWNIISTTSIQFSAGINTSPSITDNGNGTVTLGTGIYSLFANTNGVGRPKAYQIAGGTFTLTDNNTNFIYAEYDTTLGTVSLKQTNNETPLNDLTQILIYAAYRQGTTLHPRVFDNWGIALSNKINRSIYRTQRVRFEEGSITLGETSTPAVRTITIAGGTVWVAAAEQTLSALTSAANTCYHVIQTSPGVWTSSTVVTQYNNTQYNDPTTGLQTLSNNQYGINWVYRSIGTDNDMAIVLGSASYTLGAAQTAAKPTNLPPFLRHMEIIGRIIVKKGDNTATQIDNVSTSLFTAAGVTDHNALLNLQGGTTGEYYHLTQAQYNDVTVAGGLMHLANAENVSGVKTFLNGTIGLRNVANSFTSFFTNTNTVSRTYTLPDKSGTVAMTSDITSSVSGTSNALIKFTGTTTGGNSRLVDDGSFLGIGSVSPIALTKDIQLGRQANKEIGIEQSDSNNAGKDLTVSAGRSINFLETTNFVPLSQTSRIWRGMTVAPNGNVYATVGGSGDIYMQTAGTGDFIALGQTARAWSGIAANASGDVYASVYNGDIYKQTGGTGNFIALSQTTRNWTGLAVAPNGDVYATVGSLDSNNNTGDIYKQTGGTGNFIALGGTARKWTCITAAPNGDIYATGYTEDVYKQTGGTGSFNTLSQAIIAAKGNSGIAAAPNGDIYIVSGGNGYTGDIYKQTGGVGSFAALGQAILPRTAIAAAANGSLYFSIYNGDIYYQNNSALGVSNLNGGTLKIKAGTGKGTGQSRVQVITGTKTTSGTNMQIEQVVATFDENSRTTFNGVVNLKGYTVSTLPAGIIGDTAYVTDALTPTFLGVIVGGGSVITPVFYNGTNWVAH